MDIKKWFRFIDDNKWHHVAIIGRLMSFELYIDGKLTGIDDRK